MTDGGWGSAPGTKKQAGSAAPGAGSWGGGSSSGGTKKPKVSDPEHDLTNSLIRLSRSLPQLHGAEKAAAKAQIAAASEGLSKKNQQRLAWTFARAPRKPKVGEAPLGNALHTISNAGDSAFGTAMDVVSAPNQAVQSAIGEEARTGGYTSPSKLFNAAKEGLLHKRDDTTSSSIKSATGYQLKGPARFAVDVAGGIATDPLTYATFGLSAEARAGIKASNEILGAERTAEAVKNGASILSKEENARLAAGTTKKVFEAFQKGVRGGVKIGHPTIVKRTVPFTHGKVVRPALQVSEGRTILPGVLAQRRAGKILESGVNLTHEESALASSAHQTAEELARSAVERRKAADYTDLIGDIHRSDTLNAEADQLEAASQRALAKVNEIEAGATQRAAGIGASLNAGLLGKGLDKVGDSQLAQTLRGIFVRRGNIAHNYGQAAADTLANAKITANGVEHGLLREAHDTLAHAARKTKVTNDELVNVIGPALDVGGDVASVPERLRPMYDAIDKVRHRFTQAQIDAGVTTHEAVHNTDDYLTRYLTKEADAIRNPRRVQYDTPIGGEPTIMGRPSSQLGKRTENLDKNILEINAEGNPATQFETNPLPITVRRNAEAARDVANKQYLDQLGSVRDRAGNRLFYTEADAKAAGVEVPHDWAEVDLPGVGKAYAPHEIMNEVTKVHELLVNDAAMRSFQKGLDQWMNLWKSYATVPLPFGLGFHERNAVGNMFNNWLAGIRFTDPAYAESSKIQYLAKKGVRKNGDATSEMNAEQRAIFERAEQHDVIGEGFFHADTGTDASHSPVNTNFRGKTTGEKVSYLIGKKGERLHGTKGGALRPLNTKNVLIDAGQRFARSIEENARLAHFIAMEKRFGNAADAARSVRKYLFDYGDLTATEQNKFKKVMAFYTFTRKNLPLQLGALMKTPGKFSHLQTVREAVADTAPAPKGMYPSYLPELGAVPMPPAVSAALAKAKVPDSVPGVGGWGLGLDSKTQIALAPDLPVLNAASAVQPVVQLADMLPGVNKIPGLPRNQEGVAGAVKDLLTSTVSGGAPGAAVTALQALAAEKDFFSGKSLKGNVAAPVWAKAIPGLVQDRVLNGKKQPTITAKEQFIGEGNFPLLAKFATLFPQGDYEKAKGPRRRLSMATGLRAYPLDAGASRGEAIRRNERINAFLAKLKDKGIKVPSSTTKKKKGGGW